MRRYIYDTGKFTRSKSVDAFIEDILVVCRKHKLVISHEDPHGAFIVESLNKKPNYVKWLSDAFVGKTALRKKSRRKSANKKSAIFERRNFT